VKQEVDDTAAGHGTAEPVRFLTMTKEDLEKMRRALQEKIRRDLKQKRMSQLAIKEEVMSQKLRRLLLKRAPVPNTEANKRRCGDDQVKVKGESEDPTDLKKKENS
jgi:hypothetical protein